MKKNRVPLLSTMAIVILALGFGTSWAKDVIKIGLTVSTTGKYTFASSQGFKGIKIWADLVNETGGVLLNGKKTPVKLVYYDDRSEKETVVKLYEKLINEDKVDVCFGPFGSTLTGAAAAITEKYGKILIIWSAASDEIYERGYKYIISATEVPVSLMPKPEIQHMAALGVKKIAIAYVDEPFPAGYAKYAKELAEKNGMKVVMFEKYSSGTKDFTILLQKARITKADSFFPSAYLDDQMIMIRQMKEANLTFPYIYMVYSGVPQWSSLKDDGLYIFGHTLYHKNLNWKVNAGLSRAEFEAYFNKKYPKAEHGPDFPMAMSYGAGVLLEKYIETANTLNSDILKKSALDLSNKITVLCGPYEIDERGKQLKMPFSVTQVRKQGDKQELVLLYPEEVATAKPVYPIPGWKER